MSKERASFPEEPLRRVSLEPKPAIINQYGSGGMEFEHEEDGQTFLWYDVLQFPDSWREPNEQIRILPKMSLPKILLPLETYESPTVTNTTQPNKQMYFWQELTIPVDYVAKNQEHWRNIKRGKGSRPHELSIGSLLHSRIVRTFGLEHLEHVKKPILVWSVLFDKPDKPTSQVVHAERFPEDVKEEDKQDFAIGIGRITEWATNEATKDVIMKITNIPIISTVAHAYAAFGDFVTYGIILGGTYREMARIQYVAEQNGKDFKHALYKGLFEHDMTLINELIADTEDFSGCSNINELAIKLGRKRFKKPDIGKLLNRLEVERTDGQIKGGIKNCVVSVIAGGVFRNPGITEVSAGVLPLLFAETIALYVLNSRMDIGLLAQNLAVVVAVGGVIYPFATIHELTHSASASRSNMGFIPATLIKKEVTPYFTRLEKEEQPQV